MNRRRGIFMLSLIFLVLFVPSLTFAGSLQLQLTLPQNTGQFIPFTFGSYGIGGVAVDTSTNPAWNAYVYLSDKGNNLIHKFDGRTGALLASWPVTTPWALTTDSQGNVYALCYFTALRKFDADGNVLLTFDAYANSSSDSVAVDGAGNIFVSNNANGRIYKFDKSGKELLEWSLPAGSNPKGIAVIPWGVGGDNVVLVADSGNKCIEIYAVNGNLLGQWTGPGQGGATGFGALWGVTVDALRQLIYVFDGGAILQFRIHSLYAVTFLRQIGSNGLGKGQTNSTGASNGLAVDSAGNVYVVGSSNGAHILKFDASGGYLAQWGGTMPSWQINGVIPAGVALDGAGHIYVNVGKAIQRFDATGRFLSQWTEVGINQPCLAVDATGNVLVPVFFSSASIKKFDNWGWGFLLGQWEAGNGTIAGVAVGQLGNIYVADWTNCLIKKFDPNGNLLKQWGSRGPGNGQFQYLYALATDGGGNVYVADWNRIQKFDANGNFLAAWGTFGHDNGQFSNASGVAVDAAGHVFVADSGNKRIQAFTSDGGFLAAWSTYQPGSVAFNNPSKVAVDGQGRLYVTDSGSTTTSILVFTVPPVGIPLGGVNLLLLE